MGKDDDKLYRLTTHAQEEAIRRNIPLSTIDSVLNEPGQIVNAHSARKVYQSKVKIDGKLYLVRAIIEEDKPLKVITVYRTSKIEKYWSEES